MAHSDSRRDIADVLLDLAFDQKDADNRKAFLQLGDRDAGLLRRLQPLLQDSQQQALNVFYEHLQAFDDTRHLLESSVDLDKLKAHQTEYFQRLFSGRYDWAYCQNRLQIGATHQQVGLDTHWYIGAYSQYLSNLLPEIIKLLPDRSIELGETITALLKVVFLDISLAIDTYQHAAHRTIRGLKECAEKILCTVPLGLLVLDQDHNISSANSYMDRFCQQGHLQLYGRKLDSLFPHHDLSLRINDALAHAHPQHGIQIRQQDTQGNEVYLQFTLIPMQAQEEGDDETSQLLVVIEDLTEKNQLFLQTVAADTRVRKIMENVADGIITIDTTGQIESFNPAAERLFGYAATEVIGKNINLLMPEPFHSQHDSYIKRYRDSGNKRCIGKGFREVEGKRRDGSIFPLSISISEMQLAEETLYIGVVHDISERIASEEQMAKLSRAVEQSADAVLITDKNGIIEYVNRGFEQTTGFTSREVIGKKPNILKSGLVKQDIYAKLWQTILNGEVFRGVMVNRCKDGLPYYEEKTITPLLDQQGNITHFVSTGKDITERMRTQKRLRFLAHHDTLTTLPNRLLFLDRLEQALNHAQRHQKQVAVMFLDLDRFKVINDTLGHPIGDALLKELSDRLQALLRNEDTIARLSGDEFAIMISQVRGIKDIGQIAQKLLAQVSKPFRIKEHELFVTSSIGIAVYPSDGADTDTLLKNADTAMYQAKSKGRDKYCFYTADMNAMAEQQLHLQSQLRRALERQELELFYQPQFELHNVPRYSGAEALLRWQHPTLGCLSPDAFLHLVEDSSMMQSIGDWVLYSACQQQRYWIDHGFQHRQIAVNLAPRQLIHQDFFDQTRRIIDEFALPPSQLCLEITENTLLTDEQVVRETLQALTRYGVQIALDDFGTGYSSLSHLRHFPIQCLKIDRSFVNHIPSSQEDCELAKAIIALGKSLSLNIVAEGVENRDQLTMLKSMGCMKVQGFYFSKPLPASKLPSRFA